MLPWSELQRALAAAVLDPLRPVPAEVAGPDGDHGRFSVYRNNVMASLIEALQDRFPITSRLVGEEFFCSMARIYAASSPPRSPLLLEYGDTFPEFIAKFQPAEVVPYLADVARLEAAWSEAYHAADAAPLDTTALNAMRPVQLGSASTVLHPTLRIVRSRYPIAALWEAHQDEEVGSVQDWRAQDVLILRATVSVSLQTLPAGAYEFLAALMSRESILSAGEAALAVAPRFDLGHCLVKLFSAGAIVALDPVMDPKYPFHNPGPFQ